MKTFANLILVLSALCYLVKAEEAWISKHIPSPMEFTVYNEVSIVHNTKMKFEEFWNEL